MSKNNKDFFKTKNNWSVIKDKLLGCYLTPYFQKVLMTGRPIYYVDCFAGKGKFEDGNAGSPLIALQIRDKCLERTSKKEKMGAIQTCFIELNYADELNKNISAVNPSYDKPEVIYGKYEDHIEQCLYNKTEYNIFLYIDPYGIKALSSSKFDKFKNMGFKTFEMLINFNSFGFFRDACRAMKVNYQNDEAFCGLDELVEYEPTHFSANTQSQQLLTDIAGGDYWKEIVNDYNNAKINGYQAEKAISAGYKRYLKQHFRYVLDMPIRLRAEQRPKYRMIHVSNHEDGCFLMAQNMQKRKDELFINIQQKGQLSLFDIDDTYSSSLEGDLITINEVENMIKTHLSNCDTSIGITKFIASFFNANGLICDFDMIYKILNEMEQNNLIQIERHPEKTQKGRKSSFWEESREKTVIIRRCGL